MHRLPLLLLAACDPVVATLGASPDAPAAACDGGFDVASTWSAPVSDYGLYRSVDAFDAGRFVHTSGVYDPVTRTWDTRTGALIDEAKNEARPVARAPGVEVVFRDTAERGALELVDTATGRVRATIPDVGPAWIWPGVALEADRLAVAHCTDDGLSLSLWGLDGDNLATWPLPVACDAYAAAFVSLHGAVAVVAAPGEATHGTLVDLATGATRALAPHGPPPDDASVPVGTVHEVIASVGYVATAGADGQLRLHTPAGDVVGQRAVHVTGVNQRIYAPPDSRSPVAFSADGSLLARGADGAIVVERLCDGEIVTTLATDPTLGPAFDERETMPATLGFSPDGAVLMAVYEGGVQGFVTAEP